MRRPLKPGSSTKPKSVGKAAGGGNLAGRPTVIELERRKLRVMEIATELFVERGYAETSLVDIAKGAGVATRTLYQHFGDKESIFREVIFARDTAAVIQPPALQDGDSLVSALMRAAKYACEIALRPRSVDLMRLMVAESNRFPDLIPKVANATFKRFRGNVARFFADVAVLELTPEGNHVQSGDLFVDLILGNTPIMTYAKWTTDAPTEAEMETKVDLFILGRFGPTVARQSRSYTIEITAVPGMPSA